LSNDKKGGMEAREQDRIGEEKRREEESK